MSGGPTQFRISLMATKDSGIKTLLIFFVFLHIAISNHVICIVLFGKQDSLESNQKSRIFRKIPNQNPSLSVNNSLIRVLLVS